MDTGRDQPGGRNERREREKDGTRGRGRASETTLNQERTQVRETSWEHQNPAANETPPLFSFSLEAKNSHQLTCQTGPLINVPDNACKTCFILCVGCSSLQSG